MNAMPRNDWTPDWNYPQQSSQRRKRYETAFCWLCRLIATLALLILVVLLGAILVEGWSKLSLGFFLGKSSRDPSKSGIFYAFCGTVWVCVTCAILTMPIGVATAIFLEEYKPKNRIINMVHGWFELLISNLAGVPSVVYGMLGLTAFVQMFGWFGREDAPSFEIGATYYHQYLSLDGMKMLMVPADGRDAPPSELTPDMTVYTSDFKPVKLNLVESGQPRPKDKATLRRSLKANAKGSIVKDKRWYYVQVPFGPTVLAGALTLMLVVLPVVIISSQEALRSVPSSLREAALGMGCTPWQAVWNVTLPSATPGIMTGSILAMSRAMGEAAPILLVSGALFTSTPPTGLMSRYTIMPLQIYQWADDHVREFYHLAAAGIIVLLTLLLSFNALAVIIRQRAEKKLD